MFPLQMTAGATGQIHIGSAELDLAKYQLYPSGGNQPFTHPYLHGMRTLSGVSLMEDCTHKPIGGCGLSLVLTSVGGVPFAAQASVAGVTEIGTISHIGWGPSNISPCFPEDTPNGITMMHHLAWRSPLGEELLIEDRMVCFGPVWAGLGGWTLTWRSTLHNNTTRPLALSSAAPALPLASMATGWRWLSGPEWAMSDVLMDGGLASAPHCHGQRGRWLALRRTDGVATVVFRDHADNPHYPTRWAISLRDGVGISASFSGAQPYVLLPQNPLEIRFRLIVGDGAWSNAEIDRIATALP